MQDDFLALGNVLDEIASQNEMLEIEEKERKGKNQDKRTIRFCVRMIKVWSMAIHVKLKELHNKHGLMWLHFSMSYHKFSNL